MDTENEGTCELCGREETLLYCYPAFDEDDSEVNEINVCHDCAYDMGWIDD